MGTLKNLDGKTAMDLAAQNKHRDIVKLLKKIKNRHENWFWTTMADICGANELIQDIQEIGLSTSTMKMIGMAFTVYFLLIQCGAALIYYYFYFFGDPIVD